MGVTALQQQVYDFFVSKNLTKESVCSIMGNISQESAWNEQAIEAGNGIGFGLCQWSFERRTQLEKYGTDIQHQLEFLWSELSGQNLNVTGASFQWINKSGYLTHDNFMTGNGSIEELTKAFCFCWERPDYNASHIDYRIEQANYFYKEITGTGGSGTGGTGGTGGESGTGGGGEEGGGSSHDGTFKEGDEVTFYCDSTHGKKFGVDKYGNKVKKRYKTYTFLKESGKYYILYHKSKSYQIKIRKKYVRKV